MVTLDGCNGLRCVFFACGYNGLNRHFVENDTTEKFAKDFVTVTIHNCEYLSSSFMSLHLNPTWHQAAVVTKTRVH